MTIETRMSHPEGGTECPPDESPVPAPPSSTATSPPVPTEICSRSTCDNDTSSSNQKSLNVSIKGKDVPSTQKCKLRSQKHLPLQVKPKESSDQIRNIDNNNDIGKDDECTNCTPTMGTVKADFVKKPIRAKPVGGGDGSKEEAASRKSMRLRLRKGNNSDDPYGPKERPRFVEDLTEIDFNDETLKIKFMDALGMSPSPKKAKMDLPLSPDSTVSYESNKESSNKKMDAITNLAVLVNRDMDRSEAEPKNITAEVNSDKTDKSQSTFQICSLTLSNNQIKSKVITPGDDDNIGWENWMKRLRSLPQFKKAQVTNKVPTTKEINESLIRLRAIGTTVKIIKSGIS